MLAMLKFFRTAKPSTLLQTRLQSTQVKRKPRVGNHSLELLPVYQKAINFSNRIALRDVFGTYTYANLYLAAKELSKEINKKLTGKTNKQVIFLCPNDANYVITQWAIWMAGQVAVPTSTLHPQTLLEYYAEDCESNLIITTPEYADLMHKVAKTCDNPLLILDEKLQENCMLKVPKRESDLEMPLLPDFYKSNCMILYTSGTTGNPKGVVLTHKNIITQAHTLIDAWKWTPNDIILHALPLHHVHGIVNALLCPLFVGAKCNMLPKYDSNAVWSHLLGINTNSDDRKVTVFMAVPTIYSKLIEEYERMFGKDPKMTEYIKTTLKSRVRLMVSGSAPLPVPIYEKWLDITGHRLLERYGMTEIGMCFSQEYDSNREPGFVGVPLPGYSIKIGQKSNVKDGDYVALMECSNINNKLQMKVNNLNNEDPIGELLVRGDGIFKEYYNKPMVTQSEFTIGKWFKTGDTCQYSIDKKLFKILGRTSVDIIKTGGYKVSALEIETILLAHPAISDCAILGIPNEKWGEIVAGVVVLRPEVELSWETLKEWCKSKMTNYMVPKTIKVVDSIPKNAMGKVNKKELFATLFAEPE